MAKNAGATHCINSKRRRRPGSRDPRHRRRTGADVIETTGVKSVIELAYNLTQPNGTCVFVGVPQGESLDLFAADAFQQNPARLGRRRRVPHIDIPRLIRLNRAGRLSFDGIITHEFTLDKINDALDLVRSASPGEWCLILQPPELRGAAGFLR